jgi:hypothetical protein
MPALVRGLQAWPVLRQRHKTTFRNLRITVNKMAWFSDCIETLTALKTALPLIRFTQD